MKYIHVRSLDRYQPGYKDRKHIWAKIYIDMIQGNHETELLSEIDFARLVKIIVLETYLQKPLPLSESYLTRKGFDFGLKSLEGTLKELSHFIEIIDVTETEVICNEKSGDSLPRVEKNRKEKNRVNNARPTLEEAKALFREKGFPAEAEKFFDYYEANGWRVGKNPMKSWTAAAANWLRNGKSFGSLQTVTAKKEKKKNPTCTACDKDGFLEPGRKCWCWQ